MKYFLICFAWLILSQNNKLIAQSAEICNWDADKDAAVVLTFDDWSPGHYPIVVPELQKRKMVATFYPMITSIHSWADIRKTVSCGNEIGNHSQNHPALPSLTPEKLGGEIRGAKEIINQHVESQAVLTFDYPYGAYNDQVIDSVINTGHIAARGVNSPDNYSYNFAPTNRGYYRLKSYGMNTSTSTMEFFKQVENIMNGGGLLVYMYHSIDDSQETYNDNWYAKVWQDSLLKQLDTLKAVSDKIWITTLANAIKYHREANCATLIEKEAFNGNQMVLALSDTLSDNFTYNQPLSIRVKKNSIPFSSITQDGNPVTIIADKEDVILFKAVPDGGEIILTTIKKQKKSKK